MFFLFISLMQNISLADPKMRHMHTHMHSDLLKRHLAAHGITGEQAGPAGYSRIVRDAAERVSQACRACAVNHLRCTEQKPCRRCVERDIECVWNPPKTQPQPPPSLAGAGGSDIAQTQPLLGQGNLGQGNLVQGSLGQGGLGQGNTDIGSHHADVPSSMPQLQMGGMLASPFHVCLAFIQPHSFNQTSSELTFDLSEPTLCSYDTHPPLFRADFNFPQNQWSSLGSQEFDLTGYLDLNDVDLQFLNQYNIHIPFEWEGGGGGGFLDTADAALYQQPPPQQQQQQTTGPVSPATTTIRDGSSSGNSNSSNSGSNAISSGAEAIKQAYWKFRPSLHDHGAAEEVHLSLPDDGGSFAHVESHMHINPMSMAMPMSIPMNMSMSMSESEGSSEGGKRKRATRTRVPVSARDKIIALVAKNCRPDNLPKAVASFPSVDLLDMLVQYYLTSPVSQAGSFLHCATFDPAEARPELLAAICAAGAVLTADPTLTKLGFAIQECVRVAIPRAWESKNTETRDLEILQAFYLVIEIGLWSGLSRKVEIAESFLQSLVTMLRRDGKFRRSGYPELTIPSPSPHHHPHPHPHSADHQSDDIDIDGGGGGEETERAGVLLETAWENWILHESFRRLAFRTLRHDAYSSAALLTRTLISPAEVTAALPGTAELWNASTANEFWALAHAHANPKQLGLGHYLDDPEIFLANAQTLDGAVAQSAFLACVWSLCWEHGQLESLQRASPRRWNAFLITSRQEELLRLLNAFRMSVGPPQMGSHHHPELAIRLEHVSLHLHTPFEDIHVLAGIEGPEAARSIRPAVASWVRTEAARRAIWHAGQIIRFAKTSQARTIHGPVAVMIYHAALALWIYGLLAKSKHNDSSNNGNTNNNTNKLDPWVAAAASSPTDPMHPICLEDPDSLELQRFTQLGTGCPCINGFSTPTVGGTATSFAVISPLSSRVYLSQPRELMEVVMEVLRRNYDGGPRPPLIDRLARLMTAVEQSVLPAVE